MQTKIEPGVATATPADVAAEDRAPDWDAIAASPEFRQLLAARRRFVVSWVALWLVVFFAVVVLAFYADGFMGSSVYESVKVGWVLVTALILCTMAMPWVIASHARRVTDPLAERVRELASAERSRGGNGSAR